MQSDIPNTKPAPRRWDEVLLEPRAIRIPTIESDPLSDFEKDKCNLKPFAEMLTNLIVTSRSFSSPSPVNKSLVIALDSGWGNGKTSFINMWTKEIQKNDSFICMKYNAWENDDSPNALIPILCSLRQESKLIDDDIDIGIWQKMVNSFTKLSANKHALPLIMDYINILSLSKIDASKFYDDYKRWRDDNPNQIFEEFSVRQENKELFRKLIEGKVKDKTLLICIDELDRCRPTFAIETLEVVKHFFNQKNVVFVFALDMKELCKSIQVIYGQIDSMMYLQKFFDYTIPLPKSKPAVERFLEGKCLKDTEIECLTALAEYLSISLRELNIICMIFYQFGNYSISKYGSSIRNFNKYYLSYLILITLKYSIPDKYQSFIRNGVDMPEYEEFNEFNKLCEKWCSMQFYTKSIANSSLSELKKSDVYAYQQVIYLLPEEKDNSAPIYLLIDKNIEKCRGSEPVMGM